MIPRSQSTVSRSRPFVASQVEMTTSRALVLSFAGLVACGPVVGDDGGEGGAEGGSSGANESSGSSSSVGTSVGTSIGTSIGTSVGTSVDTGSSSGNDDSDDPPSCAFFHHEVASPGECQSDGSCCPGEKCVPSPNYSSCVPLDPRPSAVGQACTRKGEEDDCEAGAVCRAVDPVTNEGRCVEFCDLGHACDDETLECFYAPSSLCERPCDPIGGPACNADETCLPNAFAEQFACVPDERLGQPGAPGDPCVPDGSTFEGCDDHGLCVPDEAVAIDSCANDLDDACCTLLCSLSDPIGCTGIGDEICEPMSTLLGATWAEDMYNVGYCR